MTLLDAAGIGIGPFNLSLAALLEPHRDIRTRFYERAPRFTWHPGLLFPEAMVQVSYLKDLVTLVDPTSNWSFLAFLAAHKRLYRFINANFPRVTRREFNQYLQWVCGALPSMAFGCEVVSVDIDDNAFIVATGKETIRARNIVLGTGLAPAIPDCVRSHLGSSVFHASRFLGHDIDYANRSVAVIGGGQTGAEVVNHLLSRPAPPREIHWVTRRSNFLALDESAFVNEMFSPGYSERFFGMPPQIRLRLMKEHKLASDGISATLLEQICRRMYELEFVEDRGRVCTLHPDRELIALDPAAGGGWRIHVRSADAIVTDDLSADVVILGTGSEFRLAACMEPLRERLSFDGPELALRRDFSVEWDGPRHLGIYMQNGARRRRGVADPNLSLMAWRGAIIANAIAGRQLYDLRDELCLLGDGNGAVDEGVAIGAAWEQA
jgi:lysine N6-hydroxylase